MKTTIYLGDPRAQREVWLPGYALLLFVTTLLTVLVFLPPGTSPPEAWAAMARSSILYPLEAMWLVALLARLDLYYSGKDRGRSF